MYVPSIFLVRYLSSQISQLVIYGKLNYLTIIYLILIRTDTVLTRKRGSMTNLSQRNMLS